MQIYNRADIVNFMNTGTSQAPVYKRMQGFTEGGKTLNSKTYNRQYIDEKEEREDVVAYATEISYAFDRIKGNEIHDTIAEIHDDELTGQTVEILTINFNEGDETEGYSAKKRNYSVIPDSDGDSTDAYTYSGKFKASGKATDVSATVSADGLTATIVTE